MLCPTFVFGIDIPSGTFVYMSESSDSCEYVVMTSIDCKDTRFWVARDIRYHKVIPFITVEYVSLKSMSGLCVNPCATSVGIALLNTSLFLSESSSASIAFFYLIQSKRCLHSAIILGSEEVSNHS
jgi:hypothetical protein